MKIISQDNERYVLRFDKGEDVIQELLSFAEQTNITAASFSGIGASALVTLSYYYLPKKEYTDHDLAEDSEIVSLIGNIAQLEGESVIHTHGVFANWELKTYGGHVKKLIVSATCEIFLIKLEGVIERFHDKVTGLNLLK